MVGEGLTGEEIAQALTISAETVRTHIRNAKRKLHARTQAHAILLAVGRSEIELRQA